MQKIFTGFLNTAAILAVVVVANTTVPLCAEEVTGEEAMNAVAGWVNVKEALGAAFTAQPTTNVLAYTAKDGKGKYYVVNLDGGGFVVTSGDTAMEPILASRAAVHAAYRKAFDGCDAVRFIDPRGFAAGGGATGSLILPDDVRGKGDSLTTTRLMRL